MPIHLPGSTAQREADSLLPQAGNAHVTSHQAQHRPIIAEDALGKLIQYSAQRLKQIGFRALCQEHRGQGCIQPSVGTIRHPAAALLHRLRRVGAPVLQHSAPWSIARRQQAIKRGCHQSAHGFSSFLRDEMADMVRAGHWLVLPASEVLHLPRLRLSPIGVVPQRDRRPRTIIDYSFYNINQDTVPLAPPAMQFGRAFQRILQRLHWADPRHGPSFLSKLDMADAYMRVPLQLDSIPVLGALLPRFKQEAPLVAFPMVLPMGWVESPPHTFAQCRRRLQISPTTPFGSRLWTHHTVWRPWHKQPPNDNGLGLATRILRQSRRSHQCACMADGGHRRKVWMCTWTMKLPWYKVAR